MKQGLLYVLLAALFGAFIATLAGHSDIQRILRNSTGSALRSDAATAATMENMKIEFRAQEAFVSGEVYSQDELEQLVGGILKVASPTRFGKVMPGVTKVHLDDIRLIERVRSWAGLSVADGAVYLRGAVPDKTSRNLLLKGAKMAYPQAHIHDALAISDSVLPVSDATPTGASFPALPTGGAPVVLATVWVGEPWRTRSTEGDLAAISSHLEGEIADEANRTALAEPILAARTEWEQIMALPRPFAFASQGGKKIVLRGRVREEATRDALVAAAGERHPGAEIDSKIAVTDSVRPTGALQPTLEGFPAAPAAGKPRAWLAGSSPGDGWQMASRGEDGGGFDVSGLAGLAGGGSYDFSELTGTADGAYAAWELADAARKKAEAEEAKARRLTEEEAERKRLEEMAARQKAEEAAAAAAAEQAAAAEEAQASLTPEQIAKLPPPYASLIANDSKVRVHGTVADRATADQIVAKVREQFSGYEVTDGLKVSPQVRPVDEINATLDTVPSPPATGVGQVVSMARVGYGWNTGNVHTIYFEPNQSGQSEDRARAVEQIRRILEIVPDARFEVVGHTDSQGAEDANLALSQGRAKAFASFLTGEGGLAPEQVSHRGAGELEPAADNDTELGRAKNRRVEIRIR